MKKFRRKENEEAKEGKVGIFFFLNLHFAGLKPQCSPNLEDKMVFLHFGESKWSIV